MSGTRCGRIESETSFASFSSAASTSGTPRTFFDPSSTPMTTIPPPVFANATRHLRTLSGDDKSRLYSRVFPSWRFSSSEAHNSASYSEALFAARLPSASTPSTVKITDHRRRRCHSPYRPWQNRVKTLLIGAIGVSFERKADSPNC